MAASERLVAGVAIIAGLSAVPGCVRRDLRILCEAAEEIQNDQSIPKERHAELLARHLNDRLSLFGDVRAVLEELAVAKPEHRYDILETAATRLGHPDWDCPAWRRLAEGVERRVAPDEI